jgi:hypothetical protein
MTWDIIGDIHGHASALLRLLAKLGYREVDGVFRHPSDGRGAIFVGDFIDRGPDVVLTLEIVRRMVERGTARAVLGNHEYNALCFHREVSGLRNHWLRARSDKNIHQHLETVYQFRHLRERWDDHLRWFLQLPIYLDLGDIRVVHAAWDAMSIEYLKSRGGNLATDRTLLPESAAEDSDAFNAIEAVLKGVELRLPHGMSYSDKDGNERTRTRIAWWMDGHAKTYNQIRFPSSSVDSTAGSLLDAIIPEEEAKRITGYTDTVPVFFGHYWLNDDDVQLQADNVCCVDYSVARGGSLAAYTWSGETTLSRDHFTFTR